ncbi:spore coat protein U domain-containing protein [Parasphingopyxis marina]|uniref:Spore coat protein U domain-containing protein n=1 Tax=Parasphingopyxis marina TaxID=2761622 RepID=A0A842HX85_9SPHN|nr:spore coat protein U domain-containing protein [Parasphingopyxis marina]MBC2778758.1 spore coat protein U domain-containing protein [Parasphingopyxis marina]
MKKLLAIAAASTALISAPALAGDSASDTLDVTATVQPECSLDDPNNVNFGNISIDQASGPGALLINQQFHNNFQNIWASCNYGARMTISSQNGGLLNPEPNDGPDAGDFTNVIEYRASMTATSNSAFLTTHLFTHTGGPGVSGSRVNADAFHDNASLRVYIFSGDNSLRPLAGTYTDVTTVSVGPV